MLTPVRKFLNPDSQLPAKPAVLNCRRIMHCYSSAAGSLQLLYRLSGSVCFAAVEEPLPEAFYSGRMEPAFIREASVHES